MRKIKTIESIQCFEEIMGSAWLKEKLKLIKGGYGGGVSFGRSPDISKSEVPIAAYFWYKAREEMALGEITGDHKPGIYTLLTASLGDDLNSMHGYDGINYIVENLKSNANSLDAVYQLFIVSGHSREGHEISIRKEQIVIAKEMREIPLIFKNANMLSNEKTNLPETAIMYVFWGDLAADRNEKNSPQSSKTISPLNINFPVVAIKIAMEKNNNQLILKRLGWLLNENIDSFRVMPLYIPNEKIALI